MTYTLSILKSLVFKKCMLKALFCLFACSASISMAAGVLKSSNVVLVANKANTINELKQSQLVRIYLRKTKRFENGMDVIPLDLKSGATRDEFYRGLLNKSERQLKYYWSRMMFSGNTRPPKKLHSDRAVINFVSDNVHALGYIQADSVTPDVKVIKVLDD